MHVSKTAARAAQRGLSLIESMVGLALLGTVMAGAFLLSDQSNDQNTGRAQADSLSSFQQMAGQYFIANRADIEAAMGGDAAKQAVHCLVNVAADGTGGTVTANSTKRTCAFDATLLRKSNLWPPNLSVDARGGGGRFVAIVRQIVDGSAAPTGADEMLIVLAPLSGGNVQTTGTVAFNGSAKRALEEIYASMAALGANGGFVPPGTDVGACAYNGTTKQVCGSGWKVTLSDFVN